VEIPDRIPADCEAIRHRGDSEAAHPEVYERSDRTPIVRPSVPVSRKLRTRCLWTGSSFSARRGQIAAMLRVHHLRLSFSLSLSLSLFLSLADAARDASSIPLPLFVSASFVNRVNRVQRSLPLPRFNDRFTEANVSLATRSFQIAIRLQPADSPTASKRSGRLRREGKKFCTLCAASADMIDERSDLLGTLPVL